MESLANIITYTDFIGILYQDLAGTSEDKVSRQAVITGLITEYQQKILRELFGESLYQYLIDNEEEDVYTVLRDGVIVTDDNGYKYQYQGLKVMLASFIYFYSKRRKESFDTGSGEKKSDNENSVRANLELNNKLVTAWNNGVDLYLDVIAYINYKNNEEADYYPNFLPSYKIFAKELNNVGI